MPSRKNVTCSSAITTKGLKQVKLYANKQREQRFEFLNTMKSETRNIMKLVKRNILMCHQNKSVAPEQTENNVLEEVKDRLQDPQHMSLHDHGNASFTSTFEAFECNTVTKQLLRKIILDKQKEKMRRELEPNQHYTINYQLWRPW